MNDVLTSAEAARLAGVGTTAIKRWSDAGVLPCIKTAGGHRRFYRQDVERLMREGAGPAGSSAAPESRQWDAWIDALVAGGDVHALQARLFEARARLGSWHAVAESLGGLLVEIGRRWETGALSVIEEHLASSALERALAAVTEMLPLSPRAPRCLLAAAEGDDHTLGLALAELCLREAGWRAEWAGSNTRASDVIARLGAGGIGMVALSASLASGDRSKLAKQVRAVGRACRSAGIDLALGGRGAWPESPAFGTRFSSLPAFYEYARQRRIAAERSAV